MMLVDVCSYRFTDMFPDVEHVRDMQRELDQIIQSGVVNITKLLRNSETSVSSGIGEDGEDEFEMKRRIQPQMSSESLPDSDDDDDKYTTERRRVVKRDVQAKPGRAASDGSSELILKSGQRLTDQLVKQGLLTKSMLKQIQKELYQKIPKDDDSDSDSKLT